jgi:hypothetical protein
MITEINDGPWAAAVQEVASIAGDDGSLDPSPPSY